MSSPEGAAASESGPSSPERPASSLERLASSLQKLAASTSEKPAADKAIPEETTSARAQRPPASARSGSAGSDSARSESAKSGAARSGQPVTTAKSRRRSTATSSPATPGTTPAATASEKATATGAAGQPATAARSRRRPAATEKPEKPAPEATAAAENADEPAPTSQRRRRGSSTEKITGRLSGHLPPGAVPGSGQITTEAGRYLRAAARDDSPARFGSPPGELDAAARQVWKIAFGLLVRRRFDPDSSLAEISRTVATAVHDHAIAGLPLLDAEMLVRDALGEEVPLDGIDPTLTAAAHLLLSATLADELALGDRELDTVVADAEEKVSILVPA